MKRRPTRKPSCNDARHQAHGRRGTAAFRRSEHVALDVADRAECNEGLRIHIGRGKTDQEGQGATIAIARVSTACPVKTLQAWLQAAAITEKPLFRPVAEGGHVGTARLTDRSVVKS